MTKNNAVTKKLFLFLGDGDSSVTKRLVDCQPYGLNFNIRKIECKNHLMRNYASKLTQHWPEIQNTLFVFANLY